MAKGYKRSLLGRKSRFALPFLAALCFAGMRANAADISGTVTTAAGAPAANVPVVAGSPVQGTARLLKGVTNATGAYTIAGVAPGAYVVAPAKTGTYFNPNARTVTVGAANLTNINFQIAGTDAVRPTVRINTPAPAPGNSYANLASANGEALDATAGVQAIAVSLLRRESATALAAVYNWRENRWEAGAVVGADNLKFATLAVGAAGRVTWSATLPAALVPGTYVLNATATDRALNVAATAALFNITTGTPGFSISGRITNVAGAGVAGVPVALASSAAALSLPSPTAIFKRVTDATGNFSFPGFTPGTYFVAPVRPSSYFTPNFRPVALGRANVANINFQLAGNDITRPTVTIVTPAAAPNNVYTTLATASGTAADTESGIVGVGVVLSRRAAGTTLAAVWNWRLNQWSLGVATGPDFIKPATLSTSGNWSVPLPRTALINGTYQLTATALNRAALLSVPANALFVVGPPVRTFAVSGRVATSAGAGISNVTVTLRLNNSATTRTTLTSATGTYFFANVPTGTHVVTAGRAGVTVTPASRTVVVSAANVLNVDFVGSTGSTNAAYPGTYTGSYRTTAGVDTGDFGPLTLTVSTNGAIRMIVTNYYGFQLLYLGTVNLTTGAFTLTRTDDNSSASGTLRVNGTTVTGTGTYRSGDGNSGTLALNKVINNPFAGNYGGAYTLTAGPGAGATGTVSLAVSADGSMRLTEVGGPTFLGSINTSDGTYILIQVTTSTDPTPGKISGRLSASGTSPAGSYIAEDGTRGTVVFSRGSTATTTAVFSGNYSGTYRTTSGEGAGDLGALTMTVAASGAARLTAIEPEGALFVFTGTVNMTTGSFTVTGSDATGNSTVTGQLRANGTAVVGSGSFRTPLGGGGTVALNKVIANPFTGRYTGTVSVTAGPDTGAGASWTMVVNADGTLSAAVDTYRYLGAINTADGSIVLAQVSNGNEENVTLITGRLTISGAGATGIASFQSGNGNRGTIAMTR